MDNFTIHSIPGSPYGRAVLATLEEKRASYRFARVNERPSMIATTWERVAEMA